nr:DUF29 domain-containing protein [Duganella rivi]
MSNVYEDDVVTWAEQQAHLLRTGQWSRLDIDNIVEEIEDVGESERREVQNRLCVLISDLLKWSHQPGRRSRNWREGIQLQRTIIDKQLRRHAGLSTLLNDDEWAVEAYGDARTAIYNETGQPDLPEQLPWSIGELLSPEFWPEAR